MNTPPKVDLNDLPSPQELRKATIGAVVVAVVLITTAVLPAEWGIDPTGVGDLLGLTPIGELKTGPAIHAEPAAADTPEPVGDGEAPAFRTDELKLTLQPGEGAEIKAVMREGDQLVYNWAADRGELFFDFHGEPKGAPSNEFTSFEKDTKAAAKGEFEAPFEGTHGWYWKNKTDAPITVDLKTSGVYQSIGRK